MTRSLLIDERPLIILPSLVKHFVGNYTKALILQQIHFLLQLPKFGVDDKDGNHWVYFTYQELADDPFTWLAPKTIADTVRALETDGYVISTTRLKSTWDNTKFYRINYEHIDSSIGTDTDPSSGTALDPSTDGTILYRTETSSETSTETSTSSPIPQGEGAKPLTEQQQWFQALCWLIGWDYKVLTKDQSGQVASTIKVFRKAGYTLQDMRDVWSKVWVNDWRYRKNKQRPTLTQLREAVGQLRATNSLYEEPRQGNHKVYVSLKTKERFECVTDNGGESWYWVKDGRKYPEGWVDLDQRMRDNADRWWDSERGEYKYDEWERWNEECRAAAVLHRYAGDGRTSRTGTTGRAAAAD